MPESVAFLPPVSRFEIPQDPFVDQARSLLVGDARIEREPFVPLGRVNYRPVTGRDETHLSTGVKRLDELLGGGYPGGSAIILYGAPFCGKQQLQHQSFARAALQGIPCTYILHAISAAAMSDRLRGVDPAFAQAEEAGLVSYIDVYSHFLGEPEDHPHTTYIQDPTDLVTTLAVFNQAQENKLGLHRRPHLVAMESMSTMLVDVGAVRTFAFLRAMLGRTIHRGGVALMCLEADMHPDPDVQMAKHLCSGIIELRTKGETRCLHVEGLETAFPRAGWVEYQFSSHTFQLIGGFCARGIR